MAFRFQDGGTVRTAARLRLKQAGVLRSAKRIRLLDDGTLRQVAVFADPLTVSAPAVTGRGTGLATNTVATPQITATPAGGFGPYTYAWTLVSNGGGTASVAVNPSNATTSFSKQNVAVGQAFTDTWRVTVTDSTGDTATEDVSVTFSNLSTGGGFE